MSIAGPLFVFALAIAAMFAGERSISRTATVAWLLLAAGFVALSQMDVPLAVALSLASVAGFAVLPPVQRTDRFRLAAFASITPAVVAIAALACVRDATSIWGGNMVLFTAAWAAMVASLACFVGAMAISRRPLSASIPFTIFGAAVAILLAGTGRSSLPEAFYGFPLRTGDESLQWLLGPVPGSESGMRLAVAVPVPAVESVLLALAVGALGATAMLLAKKQKAAIGALFGCGAGGAATLVLLSTIVGSLNMPAADPYSDEVKRRLLARGGDQVMDTGAFTASGDITVAMADLAPEIVGLAVIALLGIWGALAVRSHNEHAKAVVQREVTRELVVRGVAFLWVAWFVLLLIHNELLGTPGMGSPGEWVFTGVCLSATGIVLMGWNPPATRLGAVLEDLAPGFIAAAILVCAGLAWRFGALPGLSLGIF